MAEYKKHKCKYLIAMGCLVQRYYNDLIKLLPEVDLFIRIDEYTNFWNKVEQLIKEKEVTPSKLTRKANSLKPIPMVDPESFLERVVTTGKKYAYLKIGEGCSNNCTYCAIPYIRGAFISRPMEDIIKEAQILAKQGYEEIIVIAQDTTKYGVDLYGKTKLAEILHKISEIKGIKWIRFLYSYPETISDELIEVVKTSDKICHYFDIPIQHISDKVLRKMNRKSDGNSIRRLIKKIRKEIPDVILRTTLIVGFPGETEEDFNELYDFVKEVRFDRLGAFKYSKEEGTAASLMEDQIDYKIKNKRYNKIMKIQQGISKELMKDKIGKVYSCIIENISDDGEFFIGRSYMDVPSEDGVIYIEYDSSIVINQYVDVLITNSSEYDLYGKILNK